MVRIRLEALGRHGRSGSHLLADGLDSGYPGVDSCLWRPACSNRLLANSIDCLNQGMFADV